MSISSHFKRIEPMQWSKMVSHLYDERYRVELQSCSSDSVQADRLNPIELI